MHNKDQQQPEKENQTWDFSHLNHSDDSAMENAAEGMMRKKRNSKGYGESDHEIHIWTERERRKKMRNMFSNLHALLPQLPAKADKSTIVDEAINYIKSMQQTLQNLEDQKSEKVNGNSFFRYDSSPANTQNIPMSREAFLAEQGGSSRTSTAAVITSPKPSQISSILKYPVLFRTWTSSNVVLNMCGDEAQISICSPKKTGLFTAICCVLQKHNIEVLSAHVSSQCNTSLFMIQALHEKGASDQYGDALGSLEEIYRQAVSEIMCWVSS